MRRSGFAALALTGIVFGAGCVGSRRAAEYTPPVVATAVPAAAVGSDGVAKFDIVANQDNYQSVDEIPAGRVSVTLRNQAPRAIPTPSRSAPTRTKPNRKLTISSGDRTTERAPSA